jgi:hypothetical protein
MAVVQYSNVYRSGAAVGSPVTSLYICDSTAELPAGILGDLAIGKNFPVLYFYNGTAWAALVQQNQLFSLFTPVTISGDIPVLNLDDDAIVATTRVYNISGALHISSNCSFDGSVWHIDDPALNGQVIVQSIGTDEVIFYRINKSDGSPNPVFSFNIATGNVIIPGQIYQLGRSTPNNTWIDIPFSSGNFWAGGGTGGTFTVTSQTALCYMLDGNTLYLNFWIDGTAAAPAFGVIHFTLPASLRCIKAISVPITVYESSSGILIGRFTIASNDTFAYIYTAGQANYVGPTVSLQGQAIIPIG